tara:strand:- start:48671 stop:48994 length:324 start_codon:yes stop_codon:yes gene_type:complete
MNADNTGPGPGWFYVWQRFTEVINYGREIHFLPIDHPSRQERLSILSDAVGRKMEADYSDIRGARTRDRGLAPEIDFETIYNIPIIKELYDGDISKTPLITDDNTKT